MLVPAVDNAEVARLLAIGLDRIAGTASLQPTQVNGFPALIIRFVRRRRKRRKPATPPSTTEAVPATATMT